MDDKGHGESRGFLFSKGRELNECPDLTTKSFDRKVRQENRKAREEKSRSRHD
jgi:hypothetical protein